MRTATKFVARFPTMISSPTPSVRRLSVNSECCARSYVHVGMIQGDICEGRSPATLTGGCWTIEAWRERPPTSCSSTDCIVHMNSPRPSCSLPSAVTLVRNTGISDMGT
jgi:hypothetical protein